MRKLLNPTSRIYRNPADLSLVNNYLSAYDIVALPNVPVFSKTQFPPEMKYSARRQFEWSSWSSTYFRLSAWPLFKSLRFSITRRLFSPYWNYRSRTDREHQQQRSDVVVSFRSHVIFLLGCIKRSPRFLSCRYYQYLGNSHRRYFHDKNARALLV